MAGFVGIVWFFAAMAVPDNLTMILAALGERASGVACLLCSVLRCDVM